MKLIKLTSLLVVALVLASGVTGCKKKPGRTTPLPNPSSRGVGDGGLEGGGRLTTDDGTTGAVPMNADLNNLDNFNPDRAALEAHKVHFAYDSAAVRSSENAHVEAVASYIKSAGAALLVEGHCDERGTEEYNRALGERRALAIRTALINMGCDGSKIVTRSFGKDRRINLTNSESGHAENRRGEFVVLTPK
jgi:peptidoglycan-associated lipoprotein